jgi:hypothetical protein
VNLIDAADLARMPLRAQRELTTILALEARTALGHSGSATPCDVAYTAGLLLAELPIDPHAAEHRVELIHALPPNWKAA